MEFVSKSVVVLSNSIIYSQFLLTFFLFCRQQEAILQVRLRKPVHEAFLVSTFCLIVVKV